MKPEIFSSRVNRRLLELIQKAFSANQRHGTAATKTRKDVRGGGKKPWRQKGTGRARHGSSRSPIWKGGGTVFGPHPRSYFVRLSKVMRDQALISALSLRGDQKNIMLLEDTKLTAPKTKEWVSILEALPLGKKRAVCVVKDFDQNLKRASRNVAGKVDIRTAGDLNAYHVMGREKLIIEQEALPVIEERLRDVAAKKSEGDEEKENSK